MHKQNKICPLRQLSPYLKGFTYFLELLSFQSMSIITVIGPGC